jgi:hypothetical protein
MLCLFQYLKIRSNPLSSSKNSPMCNVIFSHFLLFYALSCKPLKTLGQIGPRAPSGRGLNKQQKFIYLEMAFGCSPIHSVMAWLAVGDVHHISYSTNGWLTKLTSRLQLNISAQIVIFLLLLCLLSCIQLTFYTDDAYK